MRTSRVHHCFHQELGEPRPAKCRCRELIDLAEATSRVKDGVAQWIVVERIDTGAVRRYECDICDGGDKFTTSCRKCDGSGVVLERVFFEKNHPTDIVVASVASIGVKKGLEVYRYAHFKQVPRAATIEKAHMQRAFLDGDKEEIQRIEDYGELTKRLWADITWAVPAEWVDPTKDQPVFAFGTDQRTTGSIEIIKTRERKNQVLADSESEAEWNEMNVDQRAAILSWRGNNRIWGSN